MGLIDLINAVYLSRDLSIVTTLPIFQLVSCRHAVNDRCKCAFMCGKDRADIILWTSSRGGALYGLMNMIELSTSAYRILCSHGTCTRHFWCLGVLLCHLLHCHLAQVWRFLREGFEKSFSTVAFIVLVYILLATILHTVHQRFFSNSSRSSSRNCTWRSQYLICTVSAWWREAGTDIWNLGFFRLADW